MLGVVLVADVSAAVVENRRIPVTLTNVVNSCAPNDGPITFTGEVHRVVRSQPDGSVNTRTNWHLSGVSANGTQYEFNKTIEVNSAALITTTTARDRVISQGRSDNFHLTVTTTFPPGDVTVQSDCRG